MTRRITLLLAFIGAVLFTFVRHALPDETQKLFSTPQEAVEAAIHASEQNDTAALLRVFGPDGKDIVESGDRREDKHNRTEFALLAHQKLVVTNDPMNSDKMIVSIGNADWPLPIPLIKKDGQWFFDSAAGRQEILARRIGANEMSTIDICQGYVDEQKEYAENHRVKDVPVYASSIAHSSDKNSEAFWPRGFVRASIQQDPYHGYFFRVLTSQGPSARGGAVNYMVNDAMIGGFALVAWPSEYGVSGIQTFIVNHDGIVYEANLGSDTAKTALAMTEFNPDSSWHPVQPEP